jgi:hypothetical protein
MDVLVISRQTVKDGLLLSCLLLSYIVWCSLGGVISRSGCTSDLGLLLASEAAGSSNENGHLVVEERLASLLDHGGGTGLQDRSISLIYNFNELWIRY